MRDALAHTSSSDSCEVAVRPETAKRPTEIGRLKRRGPALPGLTNKTPPRDRMNDKVAAAQ